MGSRLNVPILITTNKVPSAACTFLLLGQGVYEVNRSGMGVMWSTPPESRIQVVRGSLFTTDYEVVIKKFYLK